MADSTELLRAQDAQKAARDRVTYSAWGDRLELAQYLERERRLRGHPWAAREMTTWFLVKRGLVMASCETFHMESVLTGGRRQRGSTWAVASVFVEPEYRGRGLATEMMDLLVQELATQPGEPQAVILFSDVGVDIYQRSGFEPLRAREWVLPADPSAVPSDEVELLREGDLAAALGAMRRPDDAFALWPSAEQVDWHLERERCYAHFLARERPEACGVRLAKPEGRPRGGFNDPTVLWAADFKEQVLRVILVDLGYPGRGTAIASLMGAAQRVAAKAHLGSVILWDEPWAFQGDVPVPGKLRERTSSIPMIRSLVEMPTGAWVRAPRALWV